MYRAAGHESILCSEIFLLNFRESYRGCHIKQMFRSTISPPHSYAHIYGYRHSSTEILKLRKQCSPQNNSDIYSSGKKDKMTFCEILFIMRKSLG